MTLLIIVNSILLGAVLLLLRKRTPKADIILKILAVAYFLIATVRLFLPDDFLLVINKVFAYNTFFDKTDIYGSIIRWGYNASFILVPIAVFFPKNKYLKRIILFFTLPMLILNILSYNSYMEYFLTRDVVRIRFNDPFGIGGVGDTFRHLQFSLELLLAAGLSLYLVFDKAIFKLKQKKEILNTILLTLGVIILSIPIYVPQSFFGYGDYQLSQLGVQNIIWVIICIILVTILYVLFRKKSYQDKYVLVLVMASALFIIYNTMYISGITMARLPIQLCNLACYLTLLALVFKWKGAFDFILIANVFGTLIAMALPDVSRGLFGFFQFHFVFEHSLIFILPILISTLGIFPKPNIKSLRNSIIGFTIYFLFCWGFGTALNSTIKIVKDQVNYFYMFDNTVVTALPFLNFTRKLSVNYGYHTGYPLYQLTIYILFTLCSVVFYYIMMWLYKVAENHQELTKIKLEQKEKKRLRLLRQLEKKTEVTNNAYN